VSDLSPFDQHVGVALDQAIDVLVLEQESHDHIIHEQQRDGPDDSAAHRIVVSDDRVLNRVRQCQQHYEVKRVELGQLALPRKPQADHQKKVDNHRTQDFLDYRNIEVNNVIPDIRVHLLSLL